MKRTVNQHVTRRNRRDGNNCDCKCKHAAHAHVNVAARESCGYRESQKAHDCKCPRCGRNTRPNMFLCPHCGMQIVVVQDDASKRAMRAEAAMGTPLTPRQERRIRRVAQPAPNPQQRQRYLSEEALRQLTATIPAVA